MFVLNTFMCDLICDVITDDSSAAVFEAMIQEK